MVKIRKCPNCGETLIGEGNTCGRCGATLEWVDSGEKADYIG